MKWKRCIISYFVILHYIHHENDQENDSDVSRALSCTCTPFRVLLNFHNLKIENRFALFPLIRHARYYEQRSSTFSRLDKSLAHERNSGKLLVKKTKGLFFANLLELCNTL